MRNIEFLAKTILTSLTDNEVERLYDLITKEANKRHILHGDCTPETCEVVEKIRDEFHATIQRIGSYY